jgi:hypothetical protein
VERSVGSDVNVHLEAIASPRRRHDAEVVLDVMRRATREAPTMWGSIVGFGQYHYRYPSGREGDAPAAAFAVRKSAVVVYVSDGVGAHATLLSRLGPHTTGVSCIYLKDASAVDLHVLERIVAESYAALTNGTFTERARDGSER